MAKRSEVKLALAKPHDFSEKHFAKWQGRYVIAEAKFDGLRGHIFMAPGEERAYTSSGSPVVNADHIIEALKKIKNFRNQVLDFEFFSEDWNTTNSLVMTQKKMDNSTDLQIRLFDMIPLKDYERRYCPLTLVARRKLMALAYRLYVSQYSNSVAYDYVKPSEVVELPSTIPAIQAFFKKKVKEKHEGAMFKDPESLYPFKRHWCWLRMKPVNDFDGKIVAADEEEDKYGKPKNRLGAIHVIGKSKDGKKISTKVGSGFKAKDREQLWKDHKHGKLLGRVVEIHYDYITVNNAVRFPRFYRMRADKKGTK